MFVTARDQTKIIVKRPSEAQDAYNAVQAECSLVSLRCANSHAYLTLGDRAFATSVLLTVLAAVSLVSYLQPHSIQPASLKVNTLNV